MRTIFKQSILDLMSEEISKAEMNCKIIDKFYLNENEKDQLLYEMKMCGMRVTDPLEVYNIPVIKDVSELPTKDSDMDQILFLIASFKTYVDYTTPQYSEYREKFVTACDDILKRHEQGTLNIGHTSLQKAVNVFIEHLRKDEGFYRCYEANIAMAFYDNFRWFYEKKYNVSNLQVDPNIHTIANLAANYFLKQLMRGPEEICSL